MKHLTVGEMARLNHISEQTLRLYDKRGLLSPSFRGGNGYRYYDIKQSAVLDIICLLYTSFVYHFIHGVDVILPVTVDGDGDVCHVLGRHQPSQQGILVAAVARKAHLSLIHI